MKILGFNNFKKFFLIIFILNICLISSAQTVKQSHLMESYYDAINTLVLKDTIISDAQKSLLKNHIESGKYTKDEVTRFINKQKNSISFTYMTTKSKGLIKFIKSLEKTKETATLWDFKDIELLELEKEEIIFQKSRLDRHIMIAEDSKVKSGMIHAFSKPLFSKNNMVMSIHHEKISSKNHNKTSRLLVFKKDRNGFWNIFKVFKV